MTLRIEVPLSPNPADRVSIESRIRADNRKVLDLTLRSHQSVKWISMMKRHRRNPSQMRQLNGEHLDLVQLELQGHELAEGLGEREFAQADLDCYFPQTRHAE